MASDFFLKRSHQENFLRMPWSATSLGVRCSNAPQRFASMLSFAKNDFLSFLRYCYLAPRQGIRSDSVFKNRAEFFLCQIIEYCFFYLLQICFNLDDFYTPHGPRQ